jgi:hypothetical protein
MRLTRRASLANTASFCLSGHHGRLVLARSRPEMESPVISPTSLQSLEMELPTE